MTDISTKRLLTAQEERVKTLRKQHKTLLRRVETERKKLTNFKEDTKRIFTMSSGAVQAKMEQVRVLQKEMQATLEECAKSKKFSKEERKEFHWMKEDFRAMLDEDNPMQMSEEEFAAFIRAQAEERNKAGFDFFEHFAPPIPEEEQKNIREMYKRLAARFHPDKAAGKPEMERRFHGIMQRINAAYQRGDSAELIAIEQEYPDDASLEREDNAITDLVEQEMARLVGELELCGAQLERLKSERKSLERTQEGKMVKDFRKIEKMGLDPLEELTRDIDMSIDYMTFQIKTFRSALNGELTIPELERQLEIYATSKGFHHHAGESEANAADGEAEFMAMIEELAEAMWREMQADAPSRAAKKKKPSKSASSARGKRKK